MSDWQVGDLAACVDDTPHPNWPMHMDLRRGAIYRVTRVGREYGNVLFGRHPSLWVAGAKSNCANGFSAARFRKIRPDEREACEPEFIQLLNRSKAPLAEPAPNALGLQHG